MVRYTKAQIAEEAEKWLSGAVTQRHMTNKEWFAMKRRINRAGFKKLPTHYKASTKGISSDAWVKRRNELARNRYHQKKLQQQEEAEESAAEVPPVDWRPIMDKVKANRVKSRLAKTPDSHPGGEYEVNSQASQGIYKFQ